MAIQGVILDVDGTLVDSNNAHAWAWVEAFERHGLEVSFEQVRPLIGMGGDNLVPELTGIGKDDPLRHQISEAWKEIFQEKYLPRVRAFPKTRELLERMQTEGLRRVVASSAKEELLGKLLEIARVQDLVEARISSDDAQNSKPDPDIVKAALERLGLPPDQVVMLGDTPYDIEAAGRLGIGTIALRCGGFLEGALDGAIAVYEDPEDLLRQFDTSVLSRNPTALTQGQRVAAETHKPPEQQAREGD